MNFRIIKYGYKLFFPFVGAYFGWMIRYSKNPCKYPLELRFKRVQGIARKVCKAFKMDIESSSFDSFKNTDSCNHLIVSNHQSALDAAVLLAIYKTPVTFIAKKEGLKFPFVGKCIKILDGEFLDRNDSKQALRTFMSVQKKLLDNNKRIDIILFPEGGTNKDPENTQIKEFKAGAFRCALKTHCPIDVLANYGTFRAARNQYKTKRNPVEIEHITTLRFEDYKDDNTESLSLKLHELVDKKVEDFKANKDKIRMEQINKKI
jgi:1-acyl-sn-glycerol-3-phosphate acyltransferase